MDLLHIAERLDEIEPLRIGELGCATRMGANGFVGPEEDMHFAEFGGFKEKPDLLGTDVVESRRNDDAIHEILGGAHFNSERAGNRLFGENIKVATAAA